MCVVHSFGSVYFGAWQLPTGEEVEVAVKVRLNTTHLAISNA